MHLRFRNVNDAFREIVTALDEGRLHATEEEDISRFDEPLLLTLANPCERIHFNAAVDGNPFWHLYRSLWDMAGSHNPAPLLQFSEAQKILPYHKFLYNGAEGNRWRYAQLPSADHADSDDREIDQVAAVISQLKINKVPGRAVIAAWEIEHDLLRAGGGDCGACAGRGSIYSCHTDTRTECWQCEGSKIDPGTDDLCRYTHIYFATRPCRACKGAGVIADRPTEKCDACIGICGTLDMTVCGTRLDVVQDVLRLDIVRFSMLQEYVACGLGMAVGLCTYLINDPFISIAQWDPLKWLGPKKVQRTMHDPKPARDAYIHNKIAPTPIVSYLETWQDDCTKFVQLYASGESKPPEWATLEWQGWSNTFFKDVAQPMMNAWQSWKLCDDGKLSDTSYMQDVFVKSIVAEDWRIAADTWLKAHLNKKGK